MHLGKTGMQPISEVRYSRLNLLRDITCLMLAG